MTRRQLSALLTATSPTIEQHRTFFDPAPAKRLPAYAEVDGLVWHRALHLAAKGFVWRTTCKCGAHLTTDLRPVKPAALKCRVCGVWWRLP